MMRLKALRRICCKLLLLLLTVHGAKVCEADTMSGTALPAECNPCTDAHVF
uniref:Uncharacterized protein n=1 Tax=Callorhinchus milii TaxID=7868 RepID=A0A4W3HER0_CALMI